MTDDPFDPSEDALWAFERTTDPRTIYVTDIDWQKRKVEMVIEDPHGRFTPTQQFVGSFAKFVTQDEVYEVPV